MAEPEPAHAPPLGGELPEGARFIGSPIGDPGWRAGRDAPSLADLNDCVACGLCLPHCPTYRLTGEESASPRGRIAAMRAVQDGIAIPDRTFEGFMDLCLVCRACEDVCPSHVPFGRMMEAAREQVEPLRTRRARLVRWLGFHWVLPHPSLVRTAAALQPIARPLMPKAARALVPARGHPLARLPRVTEPRPGVDARGTVALLSGCVQDRWFHRVNLATIRVLARNGWRVVVGDDRCCGAAGIYNVTQPEAARALGRENAEAVAATGASIVASANPGCSMQLAAQLRAIGSPIEVVHPIELLDRASAGVS